jgi:predicted nicotinamide N-methyase
MAAPPAVRAPLPDWPTHIVNRTFGNLNINLHLIKDFDAVLDHCAEIYPNDTDMIPYYADLWPSAEALGQHLVENFTTLSDCRIIELGCGLGLPSIICAKLGAEVIASDFHPYNRRGFERNAAENGVPQITYTQMDWEFPAYHKKFDMVIGSDLLYEPKQIATLTNCVDYIIKDNGIFILADPGRDHIQTAVDRLTPKGFSHQINIKNDAFIVTFSRKDTA